MMVPRGLSGPGMPTALTLDVTDIAIAESKLNRVSSANPNNWLSLADCYNTGYAKCVKYNALLRSEMGAAEREARMMKAHMTTSKLASFLKEYGLQDSRDAREALYLGDPRYVEALDKIAALAAAIELFEAKAKAFTNAYQAVKKIADDRSNSWFKGSIPDGNGGEDVT